MKIGEYKQMNAYLTRPGTPEQKKKAEENNAKYLAERKANTLKKYGLEAAPKNMGDYFQSKEKEKLDGGPDILRNLLIEEMKTRNLDSDEIRYLMDTKDRSQIKKQKISNTEKQILTKEATPEQVGQLAERLERNRQMTGAAPTKLNDLEARYKKPKEVAAPLEIPTVDMGKLNLINQAPDPELKILEDKYKAAQEQKYQEKVKNNSMGLRSFAPIMVKRND
jgi:hypothetical protein